MIIQDNSQIQGNGDDDDQSYSPPLQSQINKENTPDYLGDDEHQMLYLLVLLLKRLLLIVEIVKGNDEVVTR